MARGAGLAEKAGFAVGASGFCPRVWGGLLAGCEVGWVGAAAWKSVMSPGKNPAGRRPESGLFEVDGVAAEEMG